MSPLMIISRDATGAVDVGAFHDIWGNRVHMQDDDSLTARFGLAAGYRNDWTGEDGHIANSSVYGITNVYQEFLGGTRINVAGVPIDADNYKTWADQKYTVHGEGSINTSLYDASLSVGSAVSQPLLRINEGCIDQNRKCCDDEATLQNECRIAG
ncbi:autotransporter outer membrane beta-barrel domain-containing protein [Brucella pituitosa]|uniref:autotransporter outer membrane beta-barrel domain-containing protein n=1 Tax=Brucella pituitosa TaxID=571256 RepID=UPI002093F0E3|nr:autotransporter outer membrane beta-barrel domain-containing protein [Brucella pituitosa]